MFKKSSVVPQRKSFSLTRAQIIEDIEAISSSEEERSKLYMCVNDKVPKVPQERKYAEMAALLRSTQQLEEVQQQLKEQIEKLRWLRDLLSSCIDKMEEKIEACQ